MERSHRFETNQTFMGKQEDHWNGLDYSDAFFACAKFRGGAKNKKYRTATYLFLVKNLGNFTNKNAKNISEILIKIGNNFNFD